MKLYEIDMAIAECIDYDSGEIVDTERLDKLTMERNQKIENVGVWIKNLRSDANELKTEEKSLYERRKTIENKIESLTKWLNSALSGQKYESPKVKISYRKSQRVEVANADRVPEDFVDIEVKRIPKKQEIKDFIKSGGEVIGCELVTIDNIQIK